MDGIEDLPNEEWREIEGYAGKYLISSCGRVASLKNINPRILGVYMNNKGYYRVCLSKDGVSRHFLVSRLVAAAFCPNDDPQNKTTIDHINNDCADNRARNL